MSTITEYGALFPTSVVGSLPRSSFVRELVSGEQQADQQKARAMDAAVTYIARLQETAGLDVISDGEWRRASYIGVIAELSHGFEVGLSADGRPWTIVVDELVPKETGFVAAEARFLKGVAAAKIKVTLPAPALLGERMWDPQRSAAAYPTRRDFVEACVPILRKEAELLAREGVDVIQIDDPHLCLLVDEDVRRQYDGLPGGAEGEAAFSVEMNNAVIAGIDNVKIAVHLCRRAGARVRGEESHSGDYSAIIEHLNRLDVDHLTMEFAAPGVGEIEALRSLRDDIEIGLGCVTVEPGLIDAPEAIVERVERALDVVAPGRIILNPDCGFAPGSAARVDIDEVYAKLKSMVAAAQILRQRHG